MNKLKHSITALKEYDTLKQKIAVLQMEIVSQEGLIEALKGKCKAQENLINTQRERIERLERLTKETKFYFASSTPTLTGIPEAEVVAHNLTAQINVHIREAIKEHIELLYCTRAKTAKSPFYRYLSLEVTVLPNGAKEYIAGMKLCPFMPFENPVVSIRDFRQEATHDEG